MLLVPMGLVAGVPIAEYCSTRLWQPIGAEADASWLTDSSGLEVGYMGFNATLRDYGRFAAMLAHGGRVGERQVVPASWLKEATCAHFNAKETNHFFGYGYQCWIFPENDGSFAFLGVRGQAIFVDPEQHLVLVHTAVDGDSGRVELRRLWHEFCMYVRTSSSSSSHHRHG